jgi:hypothetical protein
MSKGGTGSDDKRNFSATIAAQRAEQARLEAARIASEKEQVDSTSTGPLSVYDARNNPDKALADVTRSLDERKREFFWQLEDELLATIDDTSIIDQAKESANLGYAQQAGRTERELGRYGMVQTSAQKAETSRLANLDKSRNYAETVNNARLAQFDRNEGVKNQLLSNSRALTGQTIDGLSNAASLQTQRENNYENQKAAYKSQKYQSIAQLGGTAMMAFALM